MNVKKELYFRILKIFHQIVFYEKIHFSRFVVCIQLPGKLA